MRSTRFILLLIGLLVFQGKSKAQEIPHPQLMYASFDSTQNGNLFFRFEDDNFLWNNEFKSPVTKGYTLIGYHLRPTLQYYLSSNLKIQTGVNILKYTGRDGYSKISPWLSAEYMATPDLKVVFGNLNNNDNHNLILPLFDQERYFTARPEEGLQFIYHHGVIKAQTWVNWEQFIFNGDPFKEEFTYGLSSDINLLSSNNFVLSWPLQLTARHHGGEIDTSPDKMESLGNMATGVKSKITSTDAIYELQALFTGYKDLSHSGLRPYSSGSGLWLEASAAIHNNHFILNYWSANKYLSPLANSFLLSANYNKPEVLAPRRQMVLGSYRSDFKITKGSVFSLGVNSAYDLKESQLSYTWFFNLVITRDFLLKKGL
ncbi:MAG: hypothetical protein Q8859_05055 [Bacteroidota bacterium]|nr:hypothetical protein [Bacteroidota bacterium]